MYIQLNNKLNENLHKFLYYIAFFYKEVSLKNDQKRS